MSRRQSAASLQFQARRQAETWGHVQLWRAADELIATGKTEFTLDDPDVQRLGLGEQEMRKLCHGTDCIGVMTMDVVWKEVEPTAHQPSGKAFDHWIWRVG